MGGIEGRLPAKLSTGLDSQGNEIARFARILLNENRGNNYISDTVNEIRNRARMRKINTSKCQQIGRLFAEEETAWRIAEGVETPE